MVETVVTTKSNNFNLESIVNKARGFYKKTETAIAKQISTGVDIVRPEKDSDFVKWTSSDHWAKLTGILGIPFGKIVQISGKPDSGKSTHAACFMVDAQKQGVLVILWDSEGKFAKRRFEEKMGGNASDLIIVNTNNIEEGAVAIANIVYAAKSEYPKCKILLVWDSVGASINSKENDEDTEDFSSQPGVDAREIGRSIRKINKLMFKYFNKETGEHSIAALIVNQVYDNIGSVGSKEKGGGQLAFLSSIIIQMSRVTDLIKTKNKVKVKHGIVTRAKVKKNHLFDGDECVAELNLEVSSSGIKIYGASKSSDDGSEILEEDED